MGAFLEPVGCNAFVLRAGRQAMKYGDPYTASGTVVVIHEGWWRRLLNLLTGKRSRIAEVRGFTRRLDDLHSARETMYDIGRCLRDAGFTEFRWERRGPDGTRTVKIRI